MNRRCLIRMMNGRGPCRSLIGIGAPLLAGTVIGSLIVTIDLLLKSLVTPKITYQLKSKGKPSFLSDPHLVALTVLEFY